MAILTQKEILERIKKGDIKVEPSLDIFQLQAHSIDLRIGYTFLVPKRWRMTDKGREALSLDYLNQDNKNNFDVIELEKGQFFELLPGEYILASTLETISWPDDLMSVLYPRSSTNRRGLSVDLTGIIDSGYEGQLIIPIRNNTSSQTIKIYPGERFCQITFDELSDNFKKPEGRYQRADIIEGYISMSSNPNVAKQDIKEIDFIQKGNITELKESFKVHFDEN